MALTQKKKPAVLVAGFVFDYTAHRFVITSCAAASCEVLRLYVIFITELTLRLSQINYPKSTTSPMTLAAAFLIEISISLLTQ